MQAGVSTDHLPYSPESDLTPEERIDAIAEILLDAIREMYAERNREKTRRCRARQAAATTTSSLDDRSEQSRHEDGGAAPAAASAPT